LDHDVGFEEKRQFFFKKIGKKSPKIVIVKSTPGFPLGPACKLFMGSWPRSGFLQTLMRRQECSGKEIST
jgi:hypothetical protein